MKQGILYNTRCLVRNIRFIARYTRGVFLLEILFFVISGLLPPLNVAAVSLVISGAQDWLGGRAFSQTALAAGLVLFGLSLFAQRMILLGQMPLSSVFQYRIKNRIDRMVVEKTVSLPYANVENPDFQTKLAGVRRFADGLPGLLFGVLSVFQAGISLLLLLVPFQGQAWLILPLVLGELPEMVLSMRISRMQHELNLRQMDGRRRQDYYVKLSTGTQYVKEKMLFGLGPLFAGRWEEQTDRLNQGQISFLRSRSGLGLLGSCASLAALAFCTVMVLLFPSTDAARFVSLTTALVSIQQAFGMLISSSAGLKGQLMDSREVFDFLEMRQEETPSKEPFHEPIRTISFEHVTFSYEGSPGPVLQDVCVELHSGETVAIVGENGAGKTTFVKLLLGLYQPDSGRVLCNGRDVCTLDRDSYFRHISSILQVYNKYPLTAAQNIDLFATEGEPPGERIMEAVRQCGLEETIEKLPSGYQTRLTNIRENGVELSGGQWQRLAIARGMCKSADLFIMDEPTAALDPLLEAEILTQFVSRDSFTGTDALRIIVSHRIGIATKTDRILVFKEGRLEETGTHEELLRRNGYYAELYSTQAQWYQKEGEEAV